MLTFFYFASVKYCARIMSFKRALDMKGPVRPAPLPPPVSQSRYSPVTNWNDDPFGSDVFEPTPLHAQKKKPPPRPPPPKINHPTNRPSHFIRKPTILTNILTRSRGTNNNVTNVQTTILEHNESQVELFKKVSVNKNAGAVPLASLIDLSSPPSSPTFTTRSSSDGLSIDSFGSDATSSTNNHLNSFNNGNVSQAESGFEDDFDLFSSSQKNTQDGNSDDWVNFDPFSPPVKPTIAKKPVVTKGNHEYLNPLCNGKTVLPAVRTVKVPTIIRAKPARPKPPENLSLLKVSFGQSPAPFATMSLNMAKPIDKANVNEFMNTPSIPIPAVEREASFSFAADDFSPPMPTIPPPPPPVLDEKELPAEPSLDWPDQGSEVPEFPGYCGEDSESEPHAIALFDYLGDQDDDLPFKTNARIKLIKKINNEWYYGSLRSGNEGMFPASYVDIRVPLSENSNALGTARALYSFAPTHKGDLPLTAGNQVRVLNRIDEEWYYGEANGKSGQFPVSYVQMY